MLLFVYCNLKRNKPFYSELRRSGAVYIDTVETIEKYPMVVRNGESYMLDLPDEGHKVTGELYNIKDISLLYSYFKYPKDSDTKELVVYSNDTGENIAITFYCIRKDIEALFNSGKLNARNEF